MTRYLWEQRIDVNHLICLNCAVVFKYFKSSSLSSFRRMRARMFQVCDE